MPHGRTEPDREHTPPPPAEVQETWRGPDGDVAVTSRAAWLVLREDEKPVAEVFSVAYVADDPVDGQDRPVTFVFNGGPGASSVYLHLGALGPRRVGFSPDGRILPPPARLVDNTESWLAFTDLVFVDPVGTGFSRVVEPRTGRTTEPRKGEDKEPDPKAFFGLKRDLESLGEFVARWLSEHGRWGSPVYVAGESYGGFRAAKMVRLLNETYGVGLSAALMISPALELSLLDPSDYDVLPWVDVLPTMAAAASLHGRSTAHPRGTRLSRVLADAEDFATGEYATFLVRGAAMPAEDRDRVLRRAAGLLGLPEQRLRLAEGRVGIEAFARELLRDEGRVLALYDASVAVRDPFPDRDAFAGPDPSLAGITPVFSSGINQRLRSELGLRTDRTYELLSEEVNKQWRIDLERHALESQVGATDDLRYGMSLDPQVRVFLTHGRYDLVTPYHASDRLRNLMRLDPETAGRVTVRHFDGGHMFYTWESSRRAFRDEIAAFYRASGPARTAT
jgi:carboxypeptidase C (cathepsin A)